MGGEIVPQLAAVIPPDPPEFFDIYGDFFLPAYADLAAGTLAITDEIQNDLLQAFKLKAFSNDDTKYNESTRDNFRAMAELYLLQATLKCYKALWMSINEDVSSFSNPISLIFCLKVPREEYKRCSEEFLKLARESDRLEITSHPLDVIEKIKLSIEIGTHLQNSLDANRLRIYEIFNIKILFKFFLISLIIFLVLVYSTELQVYLSNFLQPLVTYLSSLEIIAQFILAVIASIVAVVIVEIYKIIKRGF
jgi:hypothetical protein